MAVSIELKCNLSPDSEEGENNLDLNKHLGQPSPLDFPPTQIRGTLLFIGGGKGRLAVARSYCESLSKEGHWSGCRGSDLIPDLVFLRGGDGTVFKGIVCGKAHLVVSSYPNVFVCGLTQIIHNI